MYSLTSRFDYDFPDYDSSCRFLWYTYILLLIKTIALARYAAVCSFDAGQLLVICTYGDCKPMRLASTGCLDNTVNAQGDGICVGQ